MPAFFLFAGGGFALYTVHFPQKTCRCPMNFTGSVHFAENVLTF